MIDLRNCDCMEYLATCEDNAFELAIVDPPYGGGDFPDRMPLHEKLNKWNTAPPDEYFTELKRVSKHQIVWGCNYFSELGVGRIVWNKLGTDTTRRKQAPTFSDCELAYQSFNARAKMFSYTYIGNVVGNDYQIQWNQKRIHPTEKPVELYEWLLMNYAKEGDRILDTHLGSGSIAIACHNLGFNLVGCELDKDYYNAACKRLAQHQAQQRMF